MAKLVELPEVESAEVAGPGFVNLWLADAFFVEALGEIGEGYGVRVGGEARAGAGRVRLREPDGPDHGRVGPERRVRRQRRAAARVRGTHGRARVLLQRRGRADGSLPRVGRGGAARGGPARGRLPRRLHRRPGDGADGDPMAPMLERIDATLARFRIHVRLVGAAERCSSASCRRSSRSCRRTRPTGRCTSARRNSATRRTACCSARRARRAPTYEAADIAYLEQVRSRLRPGDLRARRRPSRRRRLVRGRRADARLRSRARRGAALPARASDPRRRADEDVEAQGRRRLPRRLHGRGRRRRGALVPRQPRPGPDDRDRHRPRGREDAEEPRLLRPVRARPHRRHPAQRAATRGRRRALAGCRSSRPSASSSSGWPTSRASSARRQCGAARR